MNAVIMIIIIATNHGVSATTTEFADMEACSVASVNISKMDRELPNNKISVRCNYKSTQELTPTP